MRVHLRNVVHSAIERGLVVGHHRVNKLSKPQQKDMDMVVDTMMKSVWESLDGIIDFRDDDEAAHHDDDEADRPRIGFQSVDAIADTMLPSEEEEEDDEDDDDAIVPLDVLHRIRYHKHRRKP
jgi:hypothetical protein